MYAHFFVNSMDVLLNIGNQNIQRLWLEVLELDSMTPSRLSLNSYVKSKVLNSASDAHYFNSRDFFKCLIFEREGFLKIRCTITAVQDFMLNWHAKNYC